MLFSRIILSVAAVLFLASCSIRNDSGPGTICIVKDKYTAVEIVVPASAKKQVKDAADMIAAYIDKATGVKVPVREKMSADAQVHIHVGATDYFLKNIKAAKDLDEDGFEILFPDRSNIVIYGGADYGTEFGAYEFIEKYVGVRWLFPGDLGEYVPDLSSIEILCVNVKQNPSFPQRQLMIDASGFHKELQKGWENWALKLKKRAWKDTRMYEGHNMGILLMPPEKYATSHPEFFPVRKGTRLIPSAAAFNYESGWEWKRWQPCFSEEKSIDEAVKNICEYFKKHPGRKWCSLAVNDMSGHCECEKCLAAVGGKKNFLNMYNYSDLYYAWANKVAEGVLKHYPDKTFGLLAYSEVIDPPSFPLNPHIVPTITYERLKWAVPAIREHGEKLTEEWMAKAKTLGWYDYLYGEPYKIPRVWFHVMGDYYRFGHSCNVRSIISEAALNEDWREGPKIYLSLKQQWDAGLDTDKLLNEWYELAVGKKAAPYLAEYYKIWEDYWTSRVHKTKWFKDATSGEGGQYLPFYKDGYLKGLTKNDFDKCEMLLKKMLANTETPKQKARAELFLKIYRGWSLPVIASISECEQHRRYAQLSEFQDKHLPAAIDSFNKFLKSQPAGGSTESFALMTALLLEKTGKKGEWKKAFEKSPWFKTEHTWFKEFCLSVTPAAMDKNQIRVRKVLMPPETNESWQKETKITDFRSYSDNGPVSQPTIVTCAYDDENLYVNYLCFDEKMADLKITAPEKGKGVVWSDDCVELFIDPQGHGKDFYQIAVNAAGITFERHGMSGAEWTPEYKAKAFKGDTFWCVSIELPFKSLGLKGITEASSLKINFNRYRPETKNRDKEEISGWQFTDGSNLNPEKFGTVVFDK